MTHIFSPGLRGSQPVLELSLQRGFLPILDPSIRHVHIFPNLHQISSHSSSFLEVTGALILVYLDDWLIVAE